MASIEESGVDRIMIGGGADHTQESMRRMLYASTGGAEGVGDLNDLLVRPLAIPGQGVRVSVGAALIRARFSGGDIQTYQCAVYREQELEIAPNTTTKDRYDLIVMRVEDPFAESAWPTPPEAEIANEQYIYARVIPGVAASVTKLQQVPNMANVTGVALARVRVPAGQGTINLGQITDLRTIAQPKRLERVFARPRIGADETAGQQYLNALTTDGGEYFPGGGGSPNQFQVLVPEWATHFVIDARWLTVLAGSKSPAGSFWVEYGTEYRAHGWPRKHDYEFSTQDFGFNFPSTTDEKSTNFLLADEWTVPTKLRGKVVTFVFKAGLDKSFGANPCWMKWNGGLNMVITFAQESAGDRII